MMWKSLSRVYSLCKYVQLILCELICVNKLSEALANI